MRLPLLGRGRRFLRISLRTLLALVTLAAVTLGYGLFRVQQRARAIQTLERAGVELSLGPAQWWIDRDPWWLATPWAGVDRRQVQRTRFAGPNIDRFALLANFPEIQSIAIQLDARTLNDDEAAVLKSLPKLLEFGVYSARVSPLTIQALAGSPNLNDLKLYACNVDNDTAAALGKLTQVKRMELVYTDIPAHAAAQLRRELPATNLRIAPHP